ncbi:MAG: HipA domain-containing protein [Gammaproteobacteria bacterium]|nr:HipA domain-containing protein [Gammaproteobacteria bacterium]
MTPGSRGAYVWIWLPGQTWPVPAGRIFKTGSRYGFAYGAAYLQRPGAISIYSPELPLKVGPQLPQPPLAMASALRDAMPDAWGRRVIAYEMLLERAAGQSKEEVARVDEDTLDEIDELAFMLRSGSNRFGALDFQRSADRYIPREAKPTPLAHLASAAERVERGLAMAPDLAACLLHANSIGGAMPKAQIRSEDAQYIAKFGRAGSGGDVFNPVKAEYLAMRLAFEAGLDVSRVRLESAMESDVLLVERFDRPGQSNELDAGERRAAVSALTLLGLDEMLARYASYEDFAEMLRVRGAGSARAMLVELFGRMTFNVLVGNTDDHARNHACYWDGGRLTLTPAYDIAPQIRAGREASQAMLVCGQDRRSRLATCLDGAPNFLLSKEQALAIMKKQIHAIARRFDAVCDEAQVSDADRRHLLGRQFLNDLAFEGLVAELSDALRHVDLKKPGARFA